MGEVGLVLGAVDGGVGGGVDDDVGVGRLDGADAGRGVGEVGDGAADHRRGDAAGGGGQGELAGDLPGLAEDERAHQALAFSRPSRSSLWPRAWIACHQSRLSRYQRTVRRSPSSSVTDGCQPSSSRILLASIA